MEIALKKPDFEITCADQAPEDAEEFLNNGFAAHSREVIGDSREPFCFMARDRGRLVAVAKGYTCGDGLYLSHILIGSASRGRGGGTKLMAKIEALAGTRKCSRIWVDTLSYQAPPFYLKLGFSEHTRVKDYGRQHDRIFYMKNI